MKTKIENSACLRCGRKDIPLHINQVCGKCFDQKPLPQHTPTRCKSCRWVDEADSIKQTSYKGIEFCLVHARAVSSHEALIETVKMMINAFNVKEIDPLIAMATIEKARFAIEKAES